MRSATMRRGGMGVWYAPLVQVGASIIGSAFTGDSGGSFEEAQAQLDSQIAQANYQIEMEKQQALARLQAVQAEQETKSYIGYAVLGVGVAGALIYYLINRKKKRRK